MNSLMSGNCAPQAYITARFDTSHIELWWKLIEMDYLIPRSINGVGVLASKYSYNL